MFFVLFYLSKKNFNISYFYYFFITACPLTFCSISLDFQPASSSLPPSLHTLLSLCIWSLPPSFHSSLSLHVSISSSPIHPSHSLSLYIYVHDLMSKLLSSKLRKNENNIDMSLYQTYLAKLHENILKYNRLNLFKEITIGFNHSFQMTLESSESLSDGLFGKCCCYPCLQFIFRVASLAQLFTTHNRWLDVYMVTVIFSHPILGFLACVTWGRVQLPDIRSSSNHLLEPGLHYLLLAFDVGFRVESKVMWKNEGGHNITEVYFQTCFMSWNHHTRLN